MSAGLTDCRCGEERKDNKVTSAGLQYQDDQQLELEKGHHRIVGGTEVHPVSQIKVGFCNEAGTFYT